MRTDLPGSSRRVKNVRQLLLLESAVPPTGGTFTLTFKGQTTAPIVWNANADTVQSALQTIIGNYRVAVYGGPSPSNPYVVIFLGDMTATVQPFVTRDVSGLTGGSGLVATTRYLTDDDVEMVSIASQPDRVQEIYDGSTLPSQLGTYNYAQAGSMDFTLDSRGSLHMWTNNPAASVSATLFTQNLDLRNLPIEFTVYNPLPYLIKGQFVLSNNTALTPPNTAPGFTIPSGWTSIFFHPSSLTTQTTANMAAIKAIRFYVNAYNYQDGYDPSQQMGIYLDSIGVADREDPVVMIGWDDGLINVYNVAHNIIRQFPAIKHTLFVVKNWVLSGKRSFDGSPTMNLAQLKSLYATGQYLVANHSANHYRFEAGINPNYTDSTAQEQAIRWKPTSGFPTSGTFRITIPGVGTTVPLPYNATIRQVIPALETLVGVGNVSINSWTTLQLTSSFGFRVVFNEPMPIMTISDPDNHVNDGKILAGPAFSVADIVADYEENRQWLLSEGFQGGDRIVAYPEGSYGPTVHAAMQTLQARGARIMTSRANNFWIRAQTFQQTRFTMPAFDFQSSVTKLIQQIEVFSMFGGGFSVMMHDINRQNSNPNVSNESNLTTLLTHLSNSSDRITTMTYKEYFDCVEGRGYQK